VFPSIVQVIDDESSDYLYLIQELCEGGEVMASTEESNTPLEEAVARKYLREMILGIEFCHRHHILHRDIKPENVLLSSDGVVKICDFGVACRMEENTEVPKGTPAFMAPEVLLPETVQQAGPQSDVWSLGATLYFMAIGTPPWKASTHEGKVNQTREKLSPTIL
jgi:[calcium/calmodulin-dependent protein kinase] kinase